MARPPLNQWPLAAALAGALAMGGCAGLTLPLGEIAANGPATTGSTDVAWQPPAPLPASLSASDAAAIAAAARQAMAGEDRQQPGWTNAATGSSGSLVVLDETKEDGATCRTYASIVTSVRGVHLYRCQACRSAEGGVAIRSLEAEGAAAPAVTGI